MSTHVRLRCAVYVVEEAERRALKIKTLMMFFIKKQGLAYYEQFKLPEQNTVSNTAISKVEGCKNLTFFEIIHLQSNKDLS